jgi:exodeoxyribonuclease VII small subunit
MAESDTPVLDPSSTLSGGSSGEEADAPSFEVALAQLEQVVDRLEGGDLALEASLASFEEGVRLARRCGEQLGEAERRIELLMQEGGEWVARAFEGDDTSRTEEDE